MRRIVSVWLPMWPIERMRRHATARGESRAVPHDVPLALVESGAHGIRITAVNEAAMREGVRIGTALADARAALPTLLSRAAEPARDRAALLKLARWAGRYGPTRNIDGADGLWIDVTGVAHLFGGEEQLLADLARRLGAMRVTARLGLADTMGAAHALARYGQLRRNEGCRPRPAPGDAPDNRVFHDQKTGGPEGVPSCRRHASYMAGARGLALASRSEPGATRAALASLPAEALRLDAGTVLLLRRLGLRTIGQLYDLPRESLERRFRSGAASKSRRAQRDHAREAQAVLTRLDCALGFSEEPLTPLGERPLLDARRLFAEPLISSEAIEGETARVVEGLCERLADQALGARRIRLALTRADGTSAEVAAGLSQPSHEPRHLLSLLRERLGAIDAGFGIDALILEALAVERLDARQPALGSDLAHASGEAAALVDRLTQRLGAAHVVCLAPHASHIPERAERRLAAIGADAFRYEPPWPYANGPLRPPFLLASPEPIAVMAEMPEGPPASFTWRRVARRIVRAEGPERIAPEWWRWLAAPRSLHESETKDGAPAGPPREALANRPRDYYRVEDETGGAYWVFREGLYQRAAEDGAPRWFLHGLFG